ncbi:hypothetical protein BaRGS_00010379 [Batillaria attramentaria]|uniref:Uncharacterized protein n=1 Tax=Batillaria attramentaria TaxID=370345 RepID=A0ABD0LG56_9CAEN
MYPSAIARRHPPARTNFQQRKLFLWELCGGSFLHAIRRIGVCLVEPMSHAGHTPGFFISRFLGRTLSVGIENQTVYGKGFSVRQDGSKTEELFAYTQDLPPKTGTK